MGKTLNVLGTLAVVGAAAITAPAPAEARGWGWGGPGLAFGLAAGAITAGALAATSRYYYGPYGYGGYYRSPAHYAYGPGPDAYYGGPYYNDVHRYYSRPTAPGGGMLTPGAAWNH